MTELRAHALGAILILAGAAVSWWTVRRLWRSVATPFDRTVYGFGVRGVGGTMLLVMSATMLAREVRQGLTGGRLVISALALVLTGIPIWLWGGYWWGRFMALMFGVESPDNAPSNKRL